MVTEICRKSKETANKFAGIASEVKNAVLIRTKSLLLEREEEILIANQKDVIRAKENGRNDAFIDRLTLNHNRIIGMADGLDAIIALPDPVGEIVDEYTLANGLLVKRVRAPLGVIGIIFEARPNVSLDASALCIKSGNGVILRGSRESVNSVEVIVSCIKSALEEQGISGDLVGVISDSDRQATIDMLKQDKFIDVVIPRGGEALKKVVLDNATMPVVASSGGNCHAYIAHDADMEIAKNVVLNAKTNRPSTCNALETLLVDSEIADTALPMLCKMLADNGVEVRVSEKAKKYYDGVSVIDEEELYKEYDNMIIKAHVVTGLTEAIEHLNKYSTHHSECIITTDEEKMERFGKEVDSSAVYFNVSTRFTDGFELGLGAEMGISTQKLHVRGPIGLKELTSVKYVVKGNGQLRK